MDLCPNCGQPMIEDEEVTDDMGWFTDEEPVTAANAYHWWMVASFLRPPRQMDEALANAIGFASRAQDDIVMLSEAVPA